MKERVTSMPEQIACVQLFEQEVGLAHDEMSQTIGGVYLPIGFMPIMAATVTYILDCVSEWSSEEG